MGGEDLKKTKEIILIEPRGFCAGVARATKTLELALKKHKKPIYAYHEIVHNKHIINNFKKLGVIFVEEISAIPKDSTVVFSAHGVSPKIKKQAKEKNLNIIDATCPLVNKTHTEAVNFHKQGYKIILIGKENHQEVVGIMGEAPITLIENINDVDYLSFKNDENIACLTQTTLGVDETKETIEALKKKFKNLKLTPKENICYATQNRQEAVKKLTKIVDLVIVVGSKNSSNSNKIKNVAGSFTKAILIDNAKEINEDYLANFSKIGITAGASAPEYLVQEIIKKIMTLFPMSIIKEQTNKKEDMQFPLPLNVQ